MPLPFLRRKQTASLIVSHRKPEGGNIEESTDNSSLSAPQPEEDPALIACAHDLIAAVHAKDSRAVAKALIAAHEITDTYEHEEGPHTNEQTSYDKQNEIAGEN